MLYVTVKINIETWHYSA